VANNVREILLLYQIAITLDFFLARILRKRSIRPSR